MIKRNPFCIGQAAMAGAFSHLCAGGIRSLAANLLPIGCYPDITNKQVQINTVVTTLSPVEVEKRVTYPIETALAGLNGVERTRSSPRKWPVPCDGYFHKDADLYFMRQQVS